MTKCNRNWALRTAELRLAQVLALGALGFAPQHAKAQITYWIDEQTDYTGNGCTTNDDLNTVTASLHSYLQDSNWTGSRFVNPNAWPQDFIESCSTSFGSGGLDSSAADNGTLAVFAGHGGPGIINFGYPRSGRCNVDFSSNMRLGSMSGNDAGYAMYLQCDGLTVASLPNEANFQWLRQQLGWTNTIPIDDDEPYDFFLATGGHAVFDIGCWCLVWVPGQSNADAWLTTMDGGGRDPIVVSYGTSSSNCWDVHDDAQLKDAVLLSSRSGAPSCSQSQPAFWYCYEH